MTADEIEQCFEKHNDEFLKFIRVESKRSKAPDVNAFLLLLERYPDHKSDVVTHAEHDEFWLFPDIDDACPLTDADVLELVRCGVRFDSDTVSLAMFS